MMMMITTTLLVVVLLSSAQAVTCPLDQVAIFWNVKSTTDTPILFSLTKNIQFGLDQVVSDPVFNGSTDVSEENFFCVPCGFEYTATYVSANGSVLLEGEQEVIIPQPGDQVPTPGNFLEPIHASPAAIVTTNVQTSCQCQQDYDFHYILLDIPVEAPSSNYMWVVEHATQTDGHDRVISSSNMFNGQGFCASHAESYYVTAYDCTFQHNRCEASPAVKIAAGNSNSIVYDFPAYTYLRPVYFHGFSA